MLKLTLLTYVLARSSTSCLVYVLVNRWGLSWGACHRTLLRTTPVTRTTESCLRLKVLR